MVLDEKFTFGQDVPPELVVQLNRMYEQISSDVNAKSQFIIQEVAPLESDVDFPQGQQWIDESADKVYILTSRTATEATWIEIT